MFLISAQAFLVISEEFPSSDRAGVSLSGQTRVQSIEISKPHFTLLSKRPELGHVPSQSSHLNSCSVVPQLSGALIDASFSPLPLEFFLHKVQMLTYEADLE